MVTREGILYKLSQIISANGPFKRMQNYRNFDTPPSLYNILTILNKIRMGLSHFSYPLLPWRRYVTFEGPRLYKV